MPVTISPPMRFCISSARVDLPVQFSPMMPMTLSLSPFCSVQVIVFKTVILAHAGKAKLLQHVLAAAILLYAIGQDMIYAQGVESIFYGQLLCLSAESPVLDSIALEVDTEFAVFSFGSMCFSSTSPITVFPNNTAKERRSSSLLCLSNSASTLWGHKRCSSPFHIGQYPGRCTDRIRTPEKALAYIPSSWGQAVYPYPST